MSPFSSGLSFYSRFIGTGVPADRTAARRKYAFSRRVIDLVPIATVANLGKYGKDQPNARLRAPTSIWRGLVYIEAFNNM